jgi:DNA-binding MarR family transcriptional regulator
LAAQRKPPAFRGRPDGPADAAPALPLETFLPYRLNVAASVVSQGLARVYSARFGIDIPEWRVIATLGQFGRATAKTVGVHSHMHKTKVSRAVSSLEGRGLLARTPNPADMRETILSLTADGQAMLGRIIPLAEAYERRMRALFTPEDFAALERALERLAQEPAADGGSG